jgi:hypothetical protein
MVEIILFFNKDTSSNQPLKIEENADTLTNVESQETISSNDSTNTNNPTESSSIDSNGDSNKEHASLHVADNPRSK